MQRLTRVSFLSAAAALVAAPLAARAADPSPAPSPASAPAAPAGGKAKFRCSGRLVRDEDQKATAYVEKVVGDGATDSAIDGYMNYDYNPPQVQGLKITFTPKDLGGGKVDLAFVAEFNGTHAQVAGLGSENSRTATLVHAKFDGEEAYEPGHAKRYPVTIAATAYSLIVAVQPA